MNDCNSNTDPNDFTTNIVGYKTNSLSLLPQLRQMKTLPSLSLTILTFMFVIYLLMYIPLTNREGEPNSGTNIASVAGWGYNTTRDISQYVVRDNLSAAHLIPEHFCDHERLLTIMICSRPSNLDARQAIRETWGQKKYLLGNNVSLYFLLGETLNSSIQYDVMLENDKYGDIIQERFIDSYNNLTIKSVVMLKLVSSLCANTTKYLLKTDDDMYVNIHLIVDMLLARNITTNLLIGKLICGAKPIKDIKNKWYSPNYMYPGRIYPNYLSGTGYVMSVDVADKLYKTALTTPIFHLEDVYLTGICSKKAKITPHTNQRFSYQKLIFDPCLFMQLFTVHRLNPNDLHKIYMALNDINTIKHCQTEKSIFNVNHWLFHGLFKVNKTIMKSKCE